MRIQKLRERYFRKTQAHPNGSIVHHGDCEIFRIKICTCGLLHDLASIDPADRGLVYPKYLEELSEQTVRVDEVFHGATEAQ